MYTDGQFMLRFDRRQQNSVKQLSFNKKLIKKKKIEEKKKEMRWFDLYSIFICYLLLRVTSLYKCPEDICFHLA